MTKFSSALLGASLLALTACGGASDTAATNNLTVEDYNVQADDLSVTDNGVVLGDTLGNEANALEADAGNAVNSADANVSATANLQGNSQ